MEKRKKKLGVVSIILAILIGLGSVGFLVSLFRNKENSLPISSGGSSSSTATKLYTHHFDVLCEGLFGYDSLDSELVVVFNFNCISDNATPYETLGDLEGDGYIVSAFGIVTQVISHFSYTTGNMVYEEMTVGYAEARIVYDGAILCNVYTGDSPEVLSYVFYDMGDYEVRDSVTKI